MRPLKTKELFPSIAVMTGHTEEEVKVVSDFFWSEVRESLSNLQDVRIHLANLGDFTIKHWLIDKEILRAEGIQKHRAGLSNQMQSRIDKLIRVRTIHLEEVQRKEFIYNHKKLSYETKQRKSSTDLEE